MNAYARLEAFCRFLKRPVAYFIKSSTLVVRVAMILALALAVGTIVWETRTSTLQARIFADQSRLMAFETAPGPSETVRFPRPGPFDVRRGYSQMPAFLDRLKDSGYRIDSQTRFSDHLVKAADLGVSPPYREKPQAGLRILDRAGKTIFDTRHPVRIYESYDEIPSAVVSTLLYIENRELLDDRYPKRNPTVEWDRFALAVMQYLRGRREGDGRGAGGSTLATQIEKIRHSPGGWTTSAGEKIRQMVSASLRVYSEGEETGTARKRLVVEYLNSLPLAAVARHGEVIGLADGLQSWYGADFAKTNKVLRRPVHTSADADARAAGMAYKRVLSLLIAQRRPQHFLIEDPDALSDLTDSYLRLLERDGVISAALRDEALAAPLVLTGRTTDILPDDDWEPDAADIVRAPLVTHLGLPGFYQLDRLDLTIRSSLDQTAQERVAQTLGELGDLDRAKKLDLVGRRMIGDGGDPGGIEYSFTLYERGKGVNWLRLQASNIDQPFNLSDGARLDLGSTAKLRTMANYLFVMASLHRQLAAGAPASDATPRDPLTRWAVGRIKARPGISLAAFLDDALDRRYSASPAERFFTGGGLHVFRNFNRKDDNRVVPLREAFRRSINLPFVRLMRDVVRYYRARLPDYRPGLFTDVREPNRQLYLERFADYEGRLRLARLYRLYSGKSADEALRLLVARSRGTPRRVAAILKYIAPASSLDDFRSALETHAGGSELTPARVERLYNSISTERYDLSDMGYLARLHPLELWLAAYLQRKPRATFEDTVEDSKTARVEAYQWLFRIRDRRAQNSRIRIMLEREAFRYIERDWQKLGYPFGLVPSFATALGSSADRPAALGELVGIIVNDGVRQPSRRMAELRFAAATPYETVLVPDTGRTEQVLPREVARALHGLLVDTVERGTASRASGVLVRKDGQPIRIGGKTGTGDHRYKIFGAGARLVGERVISRSATFVFVIDDHFFGVVTAHVLGESAADYRFTSALAVQIFASIAPQILPVIDSSGATLVSGKGRSAPDADEPEATPAAVQVDAPATSEGDEPDSPPEHRRISG